MVESCAATSNPILTNYFTAAPPSAMFPICLRASLVVFLIPLSGIAQQPPLNAPPARTKIAPAVLEGLECHTELPYARYGDRTLSLDLFRPLERGRPLPAIVCVHGGGWFKGERTSQTSLAQALAARGFVTVTITYRLSGEAKFPAAIQDVKAAVRWLRAQAATYGIDPARIGATGLSAGGHLAALAATSGGVAELEGTGGNADQSSAIQACVAMGAQSDLESARIGELSGKADDPFYRPFFGGSQADMPRMFALASPRHHVDATDPPLLFMAGEKDDPSTRADDIRKDLEGLGIATGFIPISGAPHAFLGQQGWFDLAVGTCADFFRRHLTRSAGAK